MYRKKPSRKAQVQMGETIAVIFIFFIFLVFGFVFYFRIEKGSIEREKEEVLALRSIEVSQRASFLPEIQCSFENVPVHNCADLYKLNALMKVDASNQLFYYDLFGYSNVNVTKIYPTNPARFPAWKIYENEPEEWSDRVVTQIPISLYNATSNNFDFGIMYVTLYK